MSTGGSIESISIDGRIFPVAADADSNRMLGGFSNEVQMNGNGTGRQIKTRVGWSLDGVQIDVDDSRGDHEFLQSLANSQDWATVLITYASGESYSGEGTITGDLQASSQSTTASLTLGGPGVLSRQ